MPEPVAYMPRHLEDSSGMSDRDIGRDTRKRVAGSATSFDLFTIEFVGKIYNGETRVVDKSGGSFGRLEDRVKVLEAGFKAHTKMLLGLGGMMLLMTGIEKSANIVEILDKLRTLFS